MKRRANWKGYASSTPTPPSSTDPTLDQANDLIDKGTKELEDGNLEGAKKAYLDSIGIKETSGAWFNLGVSKAERRGCTEHEPFFAVNSVTDETLICRSVNTI